MFLQGHAPYCSGRELAAYLIGGPVSDHESVNADEVRGKLRAGMHVNLRASSLIDNLSFLVDGCKDQPWRDFVSVCTDDVHAKDLLTVGHINNVVRKAVASGLDGREVVKMATLNAAREYGFNDLGAIAPGYMATDNLKGLDDERMRTIMDRLPVQRLGTPEDMVGPALFLASSASDYIHGTILLVDGGWMAR